MNGLEKLVNAEKLRIVETNVLLKEPLSIYILSGNTKHIPSPSSEPLEVERFRGIKEKEKEPHDIAIPMYVLAELDNQKDDKKLPESEKYKTRSALRVIESLIKTTIENYLDIYREQGKQLFDDGILMPNGARIFFPDITKEEFDRRYNSVIEPKADDYIIATAIDFKEKNVSKYKKTVLISDDRNVRNKANLLGMEADEFRYGKIKNPMQQNKGIIFYDTNYKLYNKIINKDSIDLKEQDYINLNPIFLLTNQVIGFKKKKAHHEKNEEPFDIHYMRVTEDRKLVQLVHAKKFLEFYNNFKTKAEIAAEEKEAKKTEAAESKNTIDTIVKEEPEKLDEKEIFTREYINDLFDYALAKKYLSRDQSKNVKTKLRKSSKASDEDERIKIYKDIYNQLDQIIRNKEKTIDKREKAIEQKKANKKVDEKFELKYSFNKKIQPIGEQLIYIDHLCNPDICATTIDAVGGFGKTIFAAAVGFYMLQTGQIDQILYITAKTETKMGKDPGALPGTLREKIDKQTKPFIDNMSVLFKYNTPQIVTEALKYSKELENCGKLVYDIPNSMTGVSKQRTLVIIDDAHYYSKEDMIHFLGRGGEGSRFIIAGANEQLRYISPDVNQDNNGPLHCVAELSGNPTYAHLSATGGITHRGPAAELAAILSGRKTK